VGVSNSITFVSLTGKANWDTNRSKGLFPERCDLPGGFPQLEYDMKHIFIDTIPDQYSSIARILDETNEESIIIQDAWFFGTWPIRLGAPGPRPKAIISVGVHSPDDQHRYRSLRRWTLAAVNEKAPYQDRTMQMLSWDPHDAEYPNFLMFAICDQRAADRFPGGFLGAFIPGPGEDTSHVVRGDTIEELAAYLDERLGKLAGSARNIRLHEESTDSLRGTIERFNGFARGGVDNDFRRGETPIEITFHGPVAEDNHCPSGLMFPVADQGPYYATILAPGTLDTKGGPRVNTTGKCWARTNSPSPGCTRSATPPLRPQDRATSPAG
jgi:hypothetical protein